MLLTTTMLFISSGGINPPPPMPPPPPGLPIDQGLLVLVVIAVLMGVLAKAGFFKNGASRV